MSSVSGLTFCSSQDKAESLILFLLEHSVLLLDDVITGHKREQDSEVRLQHHACMSSSTAGHFKPGGGVYHLDIPHNATLPDPRPTPKMSQSG